MEHSCGNPTFIFPLEEEQPPVRHLEEEESPSGLEERLQLGAERAKFLLENSPPLVPGLEIDNEKGCAIVVRDLIEDGHKYLVIHRNAYDKSSPLLKILHDRFHYVFFKNLSDCRIFIKCKLLKVMFYQCHHCQVSMRQPIIKMAEFYQCSQTNIVIRVPVESETAYPIPFIRIEECSQTNIYQSNDVLLYIIKASLDVTGTIVDGDTGQRISQYHIGTMKWADPLEQNIACLSKTEGFGTVPMKYALQDIGHHLFITRPDESDELEEMNVYLVGTPPV